MKVMPAFKANKLSLCKAKPYLNQLAIDNFRRKYEVLGENVPANELLVLPLHQPQLLVLGVHEHLEQAPKTNTRPQQQTLLLPLKEIDEAIVHQHFSLAVSDDGGPEFLESPGLFVLHFDLVCLQRDHYWYSGLKTSLRFGE